MKNAEHNQDAPLVELRFERPPATLQKSAQDALATAKAYVIDSPEMYQLAADELQQIKALQKNVEKQRTDITGPMNQALKAVNALFKAPSDWLDQAEQVLKRAMLTYQQEEERKRREEQQRLEREAAAERARVEAEAAVESARAEKEAESLRLQAQQAQQSGDVETAARLASQAESREEQGAVVAQELAQTKDLISAPVAAKAVPKVSGISTRKVWKVEVTDKLAFIKYIAEHPEYLELVEPNTPALNKLGLALKQACPIVGVRVYEDEQLASRSA
jgi:colicin import membrane protein